MTCYEKWNLFSNFLIAIGTIGAVLVAIFGNWIKQRIFSAKLDVQVLNEEGELTSYTNNEQVIYFHLKVINLRKSVIVKNCRIYLKKIQKRQADSEFHDLPLSVPPRFPWAPAGSSPEAIDVVTEQVLDFGAIAENAKEFKPIVVPVFNSFKGNLTSNESFRYFIEIIADNYRPKELTVIEVSWDGKWTSSLNEMKSSLIIKRK